jgi:hypothetical protein
MALLQLLQTVAIQEVNTGAQGPQSSPGALVYFLQSSVVCEDVEMPVSCFLAMMWEMLMEFGTLSNINIQNYYVWVIEQNLIQGSKVFFFP